MKKLKLFLTLTATFLALAGQENIKEYIEFIDKQKYSSKDYILNLFDNHDIVIICERAHPEMTQYELFMDVIQDDKFIKKVGNVCTEVGLSSLNEQVDKFLNTNFKNKSKRYESVLDLSRNLSYYPIWEKYNYTDFLMRLNILNSKLPSTDQISLQMIDIDFNWSKIEEFEDYQKIEKAKIHKRDSIMASNIMSYYERIKNKKRNKILVILNYRHAFGDIKYLDGSKPDNTTRYIFEKYPDNTANVLLNGIINIKEERSGFSLRRVSNGRWDKAFYKLGINSMGFDFKNSPFGSDNFDMFPYRKHNLTYEEVFTGYCFYEPIEKHLLLIGINDIFNDKFIAEYKRRISILNKNVDNEMKNIIKLNKIDTLTYFDFDESLLPLDPEIKK